MFTTSNITTVVRPSTNACGTTVRQDLSLMPPASQSISSYSAGLLIVGGPNVANGLNPSGFDLLKENNYGTG